MQKKRILEGKLVMYEFEENHGPPTIEIAGVQVDKLIGHMLDIDIKQAEWCPDCEARQVRITVEILER